MVLHHGVGEWSRDTVEFWVLCWEDCGNGDGFVTLVPTDQEYTTCGSEAVVKRRNDNKFESDKHTEAEMSRVELDVNDAWNIQHSRAIAV